MQEENLNPSWETYLDWIDDIRVKMGSTQDLSIEEACWLIWAELDRPSSTWKKFKKDMDALKQGREMPWPAWFGMFDDWEKKQLHPKH